MKKKKLTVQEFSVLFSQAQELFNKGEYERAKERLIRLASVNPNNPFTRNYLGLVQLAQGLANEALINFVTAEEILPSICKDKKFLADNQLVFAVNIATCYGLLEDYKKASEVLIHAVKKYFASRA